MAGNPDDDLLSRLNALKPSTIDLHRTLATPPIPDADDGDDIARRFLGLRSRSDQATTSQVPTNDTQVADDEDVEDIDDMLKELRSKAKSSLATGDEKRVQILLAQAQNAFDDSDDDGDDIGKKSKSVLVEQADNAQSHDGSETGGADDEDRTSDDEDRTSADEDAEADELLAQILAEVQLNMSREKEDKEVTSEHEEFEEDPKEHESRDFNFDETLFPTTPSKEPILPPVPSDELQLPSAPTSVPAKSKPKSSLKKYTNEEIETWCEICQANAEVRCLGCDGELYCLRCWKEGHTGPDAGYEEKSHRCVQYSKPGPEPAAA